MPKLGGSRYADLTEPQGVTPVYWQITNKRPSPGEGGWEILKPKLLQTVYSRASCQDYALLQCIEIYIARQCLKVRPIGTTVLRAKETPRGELVSHEWG